MFSMLWWNEDVRAHTTFVVVEMEFSIIHISKIGCCQSWFSSLFNLGCVCVCGLYVFMCCSCHSFSISLEDILFTINWHFQIGFAILKSLTALFIDRRKYFVYIFDWFGLWDWTRYITDFMTFSDGNIGFLLINYY